MKKVFFLFIVVLPLFAFANAAQPGFWGAGGTGNFSLLFPEDSSSYQKIQMVKELVSVQLYRGYAVVKGQYGMYNDTEDSIKIKVGYPLNSHYDGATSSHKRVEIRFEALYGLKAFSNGTPVEITSSPLAHPDYGEETDNWYTWQAVFPPKQTIEITVYFIVNTNNNAILQGYDRDRNNGFIYLLETGATWKQPILEGEVRLQIKDDFSMSDIHGVHPDTIFRANDSLKIFFTKFQDLSPAPKDNIIIAYTKNLKDFDFEAVLQNQTDLYASIDEFSLARINERDFAPRSFGDPFEVKSTSYGISFLFYLIIYGPFILAGLVSLWFLWLIWGWWKGRQRN